MIWPTDLACFYPHPGSHLPIWQVLGSCLFVAGFSVAVIRLAPRRPYLSVGWFWYLITLLPVIGIVQVGKQAMADRYAYVPLIGLYVLIAWAVPELLARVPLKSIVLMVVAGIAIAGLMVRAHNQAGYWRNSKTLFQHTIAVTSANPIAEFTLGAAYANEGNFAPAIRHIRIALSYNPRYAIAHDTLGAVLERQCKFSEAIYEYRQAIKCDRTVSQPHMDLGRLLLQQGPLSEALHQFEEAQRLDPGNKTARANVETLRIQLGYDE
jgi:tetratricopeptide (TPR) repeat protein